MADDRAPQDMIDEPGWPARAVIFLAVGAIAALAIQQLVEPDDHAFYSYGIPVWRMACATGIGVGALAFGFGLSRVRIAWTLVFAAVLGLVAGLIVWWNGQPGGVWNWSGASLFLAVAVALPLFQVARDEGRASFPYTKVHGHAWTNVVLWGACWGFTGIVLLMSHLLAELFALIGLDGVKHILGKNWSNTLIIGAAFGAALALLRDRDRVVRLLQHVVTSVLSVLAPVLGVALILFIVSLPFTGLDNLWQATKSTTPILMACVIGALVLINAVIGHGPEDEAKNPVLRWSALALGVSVLPLAIIAALAMGLRLNQYGMTPDRLWGLVCVVFAVGYGIVYLVDLVRGRLGWALLIRRDNIRLAMATMAVAVVLATPIFGFDALSVRDQVARLEAGKVSVAKFDWAALGYDFGEPGRRVLDRLSKSTNKEIADQAAKTLRSDNRGQAIYDDVQRAAEASLDSRVRILPRTVPVPRDLRDRLTDYGACGPRSDACVLLYTVGATEAVSVGKGCYVLDPDDSCVSQRYLFRDGKWNRDGESSAAPDDAWKKGVAARKAAVDAGKVEIRAVPRRQVFIGGQPVGDAFE